MTHSRLFTLALTFALSAAVHAQPVNDVWHHGTFITASGQVLTGTNVDATADAGFATRGTCDNGSATGEPSVWYIFAATASGDITFTTEGSDFDTILTIHSNVPPGSMSSELACNDDATGTPPGTRWSRLTFSASAGTYYYVRVTGYNGAEGNITLRSTGDPITGPPNVGFGAYVVDSEPYFGTNVGAPTTTTFSDASCVPTGRDNRQSVLWFYRAQATGNMNISLDGSDFDTVLTVYNASSRAEIACNDDAPGSRWSRVENVSVTQGQDYFIRVSGYDNASAGEEGSIELRLTGSTVVANEAPGDEVSALRLLPVSPNPVLGSATITFALAEPAAARVETFDTLGRSVELLHEGFLPSGEHRMTWTPGDLPAGIYIVRVTSGEAVQTQTVTLVR